MLRNYIDKYKSETMEQHDQVEAEVSAKDKVWARGSVFQFPPSVASLIAGCHHRLVGKQSPIGQHNNIRLKQKGQQSCEN